MGTKVTFPFVSVIGGLVMAAAGVSPMDAASNLSAWASWLGIKNIPLWLSSDYADFLGTAIGVFLLLGGILGVIHGMCIKKESEKNGDHSDETSKIKLEWSNSPGCISKTTINSNGGQIPAIYYHIKVSSDAEILQECEAYLSNVERERNSNVFESMWPHGNVKILWAHKGRPTGCRPLDIHPDIPEYATAFIKADNEDFLSFDFCVLLNRYRNFKIDKPGIYRLTIRVVSRDSRSADIRLIVDYDKGAAEPIKVCEGSQWQP